jgi:site-specific DNA-methyltransferase (adenine-specific)
MNNSLHFSSAKDDWRTPLDLFIKLNEEFVFEIDACATSANSLLPKHFTDCLSVNWIEFGRRFYMNPPYGRLIGRFVQKAFEESQKGCVCVCLLPARTDTQWFHQYCVKGEIRFIPGRLKFQGALYNAPFPSMIVVFRSATPA